MIKTLENRVLPSDYRQEKEVNVKNRRYAAVLVKGSEVWS